MRNGGACYQRPGSARTIARDVGRAITGRSRGDQAARRVETAENRAQDRQEALAELEADLAEELTAIDEEWSAKAAAVDTVDLPLEKSYIRVTARSLVWIPTGSPAQGPSLDPGSA